MSDGMVMRSQNNDNRTILALLEFQYFKLILFVKVGFHQVVNREENDQRRYGDFDYFKECYQPI
jgi:hypothetical protein